MSFQLITAKPIICAQHPAVAAPPAKPLKPRIIAIAAELIGKVKIIPIVTLKTIPIQKGCNSVAFRIPSPSQVAPADKIGPKTTAKIHPTIIVTAGVTMISTFVLPETNRPISAHLGVAAGLVMFVVGTLAVIVPTPNGAGPWHFAVMTMMALYGVGIEDAGIFALLVHGIQTFLLILLGIYGLSALPFTNKTK